MMQIIPVSIWSLDPRCRLARGAFREFFGVTSATPFLIFEGAKEQFELFTEKIKQLVYVYKYT